ncbi:hypothetical protein [Peterkaempfera bronchialis]|uniref:hypothetical protein n=1 Tax=Peterkaempfera bronchialis TaxID=2126346 RepID=UPI0013B3CDE7|nr:hypothetical protein [Peterkaempfera bronchialis]
MVGYDGGAPVGYAYGNTAGPEDRWWARMARPVPAGRVSSPAFALKEIGVRTPWRGTGAARCIHDAMVTRRPEQQVTLMVNPAAGDGKNLALP